MNFQRYTSPHFFQGNRVDRIMLQVMLALVPAGIASVWYFGWGLLFNMLLAAVSALLAEAAMLKLRGLPVKPALSDCSALTTALLFALAVPPTLPWWGSVLGMLFAIVIVKQLYGGLGHNPFNPAMAGYVFLLISYPLEMTTWLPPRLLAEQPLDFLQSLQIVFSGQPPPGLSWDAISSATPLDEMRTRLDLNQMISEIRESPLWGDFGGRGWEWISNWYLLGGLWLKYRGIITWRIPLSLLTGLVTVAGVFYLIDPQSHPFPLFHVFSGGTMLAAFFIATDPVTASTTPRGQLIYGASIGVLIFVIRTWGGYPDGVAFAVLLLNMAVPTIDYYTRPPVYGYHREPDDG